MALTRRGKILLAAFGLGILAGGVVVLPRIIITPLAEQFLHRNGFPDARISGLSFVPSGIVIDHISLDGNDFSTVEGISIEGDWLDMLSGSAMQSLTVKDISLSAEIDDSGHYSIAGWDAKLPDGNDKAGLLPIKNILLQGVTIDVETPQGNIRAEGKFSLSTPSPDKQVFQYTSWGRQKQLSYELNGKGELSATGSWMTSTILEDARTNISGADISRTSGYIDISKPELAAPIVIKGHMVAGRINYDKILLQNINAKFDSTKSDAFVFNASPSGHSDIKFTMTWQTQPQSLIALKLTGKSITEIIDLMPDDNKQSLLPIVSTWLSRITSFTVTASAPPNNWLGNKKNIKTDMTLSADNDNISLSSMLTFSNGMELTAINIPDANFAATSLSRIFPLEQMSDIKLTDGTVNLKGQIDFPTDNSASQPTPQPALTIRSNQLSADLAGVKIGGIEGIAILDALSPVNLAAPSTFTFSLPDGGGKGLVTLSGNVNSGLKIEKFRLEIAGGTIDATPFVFIAGDKKPMATTLNLSSIQIEKLIALADVDGLKGAGTLSGHVPITISGDTIKIGDALLENNSSGSFAFAPNMYPASLQGDDTRMQTVRESLKDFRFSKLSLAMSGSLSGKMVTALKAEGTNPVFGDRPIHLNLNLEGDLAAFVKNMVGGLTLPTGEIHDKLRSDNASSSSKPR